MPGRLLFTRKAILLCAVLFFSLRGEVYAQTCDFTVSSQTGCAPYTVNFIDQSSPSPVSWDWDFGDGNTSTTKDPSNTYYNPGVYTVKLRATFPGSAVVTTIKTNYITIYAKPSANFTSTNITGCEDLKVNFTNQSSAGSGAITSYFYDFGNTFSDTNASTSHTYRNPGSFNVTLIVTDVNGCQDIEEKKNLVTVWQIPDADFTSGNQVGCSLPHAVNFVNTTSANATGTVTYAWDFGNGNTSVVKTPSVTYTTMGSYAVRLIVTNSLGCKDTMTKSNFVQVQIPTASFNSNNIVGCPPLLSGFSNSSTPSLPGNTFLWTFGSVATSTANDTSVLFKNQGNYTIKLVVTTPAGCKDSITKVNHVQVSPGPTANFYVNDSTACRAPHSVNFTSTTTVGASWLWDFGDGTTSTQKNPAKTYPDTGRFNVKLKVTGANGCIDSLRSDELIKIGPPRADYMPSVESGCLPLKVGFSNNTISYAPLASVQYKFGDGNTSNQGFPNHTYNDTGYFKPWIIVTTNDGCVDSAFYDTVAVGMQPAAEFMVDRTSGCRGLLKVKFTSLTNLGTIKADHFEWFPGTGLRLQGEIVDFVYSANSQYYDVLLVAYHHGCPDSMVKKNLIEVKDPTAKFITWSAGCNDDSIYFENRSYGGHKFVWNFGDGDSLASDSAMDVSHIYSPGTFAANMIAHDTLTGCYDTARSDIFVENSDVLKFRSDTVGCTRQPIWFFDQTQGSTGWEWTIGESAICTTRNCQVFLSEPGWYDVKFSAVVLGCRYTTIKKHYLHVYGPKFDKLTPPDPICAPQLTNVVTHIGGERPIRTRSVMIFSYKTFLEARNLAGDTLSYYFSRPSLPQDSGYIFRYSATDTAGCSNFSYDTVNVYRPEVSFTNERRATCDGDLQFFQATLMDTTSPKPMLYRWEYGDGIAEQFDSLSTYHTFQNDSVYRVRLVAFDGLGCTDTSDQFLNIDVRNVKARIVASDTFKACPPLLVSFYDSSVHSYNGIVNWEWTLGDGTAGNAPNPKRLYTEPGIYDVSLKITDSLGCTDSVYKSAYIRLDGTKITYTIDTNHGCEPLLVNVSSKALGNAEIRWDMRDGTGIKDSASFAHTFTKAGLYAVSVFVKDMSGCQYILTGVDSILVEPTPIANFSVPPACLGAKSIFTNLTQEKGALVDYTWHFTANDSSNAIDPEFTFTGALEHPVRLRASSSLGCTSEITLKALISDPKGEIRPDKTQSCAADEVELTLENNGVGKVVQVNWNFDNGSTLNSSDSVVKYTYLSKGYYRPYLSYTNEYGCVASVVSADSILVGDNFPPENSDIYRVSVDGNFQTSTLFEANKSIDFERYIIQRILTSGKFETIYEITDPMDTLFLDAVPTLKSPYSYRVLTKNICGYVTDTNNLIPHTDIELSAYTADDASFLKWTPYAGWQPNVYEIWRLDPAAGFVKLKEVDGNVTQAFDSAIACNTGYYYKIRARGNGLFADSWSDSSGAIPNFIPFVPGNELLSASVEGNSKNLIKWTYSNPGRTPVRYYLLERSTDGITYTQTDRFDPFTNYTYDKVDNASSRSFYYRTIVQDTCGYRSDSSNYGKTMMLSAAINAEELPLLTWTPYDFWQEGVDYYDIEIYTNGQFEFLATVDGTTTTWVDDITPVIGRSEYCYRITARSVFDGGKSSRSSIACAPVVSRIFVPNAFRPAGQSENKTFYPKGMYISEFHMVIYDRWGQVLFTTDDMTKGWDGEVGGSPVPSGVYVYKIDYRGVDKQFEMLSGSFLLLR